MTSTHISPAIASVVFSIGTGALGGVATMILAKRIEGSAGVSLPIILLAVAAASALNVAFAFSIPFIKEEPL